MIFLMCFIWNLDLLNFHTNEQCCMIDGVKIKNWNNCWTNTFGTSHTWSCSLQRAKTRTHSIPSRRDMYSWKNHFEMNIQCTSFLSNIGWSGCAMTAKTVYILFVLSWLPREYNLYNIYNLLNLYNLYKLYNVYIQYNL